MSTQQNQIASNVARFFIELSHDSDKQEQFRENPTPLLEQYGFRTEEIDALLSGDPQTVRTTFRLQDTGAGLDMHDEHIREIVRDEIKKSRKPAKKKKPAPKKKKVPAKKRR